MKTLEQLEEEAKQAREALNSELTEICGAILAKPLVDSIINAAVAMVTYQFALGMQEVSGDGSGEALPEVSQEERDSDGWIEWGGGECPVKSSETVEVKFRLETIKTDIDLAGVYRWNHAKKSGLIDGDPYCDIVAYRIAK